MRRARKTERWSATACGLPDRVEDAEHRGDEVDREVLLVAGFLHDLGLYDSVSRGAST